MNSSYKLTSDRTAHITATDDATIIQVALAARSECVKGRIAEKDAIREYLNGQIIVPHNAAALGEQLYGIGFTGPMMNPVKRNPGTASTKIKRAFRFTIEGRPGKFKLRPVHENVSGMRACGVPVDRYEIELVQPPSFL
jgi:hypothetical protein